MTACRRIFQLNPGEIVAKQRHERVTKHHAGFSALSQFAQFLSRGAQSREGVANTS